MCCYLLVELQKDLSDLHEINSVACYNFKKLLFMSSWDILHFICSETHVSIYQIGWHHLLLQVILCIFCLVNSILTLVRAFSFAFGGLKAAIRVHDQLLHNLIDSPVSFFDQNPSGRILNR